MAEKGPSLDSFLQQGDTPRPRADEIAKTFKRRSSNINLQKSIQLLDDAVSPSINRLSRTPRPGFRNSMYTPVGLDSKLDNSEAFMFTPAKKAATAFHPVMDSPATQGISPLMSVKTSLQTDNTMPLKSRFPSDDVTLGIGVTEEVTNSNITLVTDEDPGKKAATGLFAAFAESHKKLCAPQQVLDLLSEYESSCSELVMKLKKLSKSVTRNKPKLEKTVATFELLLQEKNTWKLMLSLYKDRLETEARDEDITSQMEDDEMKTTVWGLSEQNIANRLFEKDSVVRQSQLVLDWLETCACDNLDTYDNTKFFSDEPVCWENTLHHLLKSKESLRSYSDRFVTEMDPDAPHRQKKVLDDLDQEDERNFMKNLFVHVRAGRMDKAQELCHSCGQPWRAATLEGWRLLHDPNYVRSSALTDVAPVDGNRYRDVWKSVCWRMAAETQFDIYERAVYASLSGNLKSLLPVCTSWMDYVWAYFKAMVDIKVEQEIQLHLHTPRVLEKLPAEYWDRMLEPAEIFKDISASVNETVRLQSENWYHVVQKFIVLGDISALIEVLYSWLQKDRDSLPGHLVRLMAHIVLFLRSIGHACKDELCESILEAYIEDLIRGKHKEIIAHYVATLSPAAQIQWYATFLEDIEDQDERQQCLRLAEEEQLDVALITKTVVERIRCRDSTPLFPENSLAADLAITEEDQAKINAIDWLIFDQSHRPEALKQANAIMRSFIVTKKHVAARQAFEKLPADTIDVIFRLWHHKTGKSELPASDSNAIREYMCIKAYLDAVESFNDWFTLYHQGRPMKPSGNEGSSFTDRVAMEHKMKQFQQEQDRWMHNLLLRTRTTRDRIYNVLLFADGGWLVDAVEDRDECDDSRQHQMAQLRKLHLPGLCVNLHSMLHASGMYAQAVHIADVVASEQHQLYKEFDGESLKHLLTQISSSAHALLDENKDPLGYEMV